jgi:hypothetical protein
MFSKYAAPAMREVDIAANADCHCGCTVTTGGGGGDGPRNSKEAKEALDKWYRDLRKQLEKLKKDYPDYDHPELEDN